MSEFLASGNAICGTMNTKPAAVPTPGDTAAAQAAYLDQQVALTQDALTQLRALPEPAGQAAALQSLFAKVDTLITLGEQESAALNAGNLAVADQIDSQASTATDAANAAFNAYGLTVCGS